MSLRHDPDGLGLVSGLAGLPLPILEMGLDEPAQCRLRSHDTTTERKRSHTRGWCVLWSSMQDAVSLDMLAGSRCAGGGHLRYFQSWTSLSRSLFSPCAQALACDVLPFVHPLAAGRGKPSGPGQQPRLSLVFLETPLSLSPRALHPFLYPRRC